MKERIAMKTKKNIRSPESTAKITNSTPAKRSVYSQKVHQVLEGQLVFYDMGIEGCEVFSMKNTQKIMPSPKDKINLVIKDNISLVRYWLRRTSGVTSINEDDIYQAGLMALWRAAQQFDPSKGFTFATYASTVIRRGMYQAVRKNQDKNNPAYLDELLETASSAQKMLSVSEEDSFASDGSEIFQIMRDVSDTLSSLKEKKAVQALAMNLQGYSKEEIAQALEISVRSYTALISTGRKVLQRHPMFLQNAASDSFRKEYTVELLGCPFKLKYAKNPIFDFPVKNNNRLEESLCRALSNEEAADYILNEVRIGESICIADADVGYTAVMDVYEDVLEITFVSKSRMPMKRTA